MYCVKGFYIHDETSANLFQISPGVWRHVIIQSNKTFHSPDIFESAEVALKDLKQWLFGDGFFAIYEDTLSPYVEALLLDYFKKAANKGFCSIQLSRSGNKISNEPKDLEITVHTTTPASVRI